MSLWLTSPDCPVKEAFMRMQEEDVAVKPLSNVQQQQHELAILQKKIAYENNPSFVSAFMDLVHNPVQQAHGGMMTWGTFFLQTGDLTVMWNCDCFTDWSFMCCIWEQRSFCLFLVRCRRMDRPAALCAIRRRRRSSRRAAIGCCLHVRVSWLARGKPSAFIQYRNKKISSQNDAAWIDWPAASVSSLDYFLLPSSFDLFLPEKSINKFAVPLLPLAQKATLRWRWRPGAHFCVLILLALHLIALRETRLSRPQQAAISTNKHTRQQNELQVVNIIDSL